MQDVRHTVHLLLPASMYLSFSDIIRSAFRMHGTLYTSCSLQACTYLLVTSSVRSGCTAHCTVYSTPSTPCKKYQRCRSRIYGTLYTFYSMQKVSDVQDVRHTVHLLLPEKSIRGTGVTIHCTPSTLCKKYRRCRMYGTMCISCSMQKRISHNIPKKTT